MSQKIWDAEKLGLEPFNSVKELKRWSVSTLDLSCVQNNYIGLPRSTLLPDLKVLVPMLQVGRTML